MPVSIPQQSTERLQVRSIVNGMNVYGAKLPSYYLQATYQAIVTYDTSCVNVRSYLPDRLDTDNTGIYQLAGDNESDNHT